VPAQPRKIFGTIRALHLAEDLLEGIEVIRREPDLVGARWSRLMRIADWSVKQARTQTGIDGNVTKARTFAPSV
jgi:hypothetical protein